MKINKVEFARRRNWMKARVIGLASFDDSILTPKEREIIKEIKDLKNKLLDQWDEGSKELGMKLTTSFKIIYKETNEVIMITKSSKIKAKYRKDPDFDVKPVE